MSFRILYFCDMCISAAKCLAIIKIMDKPWTSFTCQSLNTFKPSVWHSSIMIMSCMTEGTYQINSSMVFTYQLHSVTYSYADACWNIFNTIKTSGHSSLEKYTSHFIWKGSKGLRKVLSVRGELETEQNCNILTPQLFWLQQHFFPVLQGCSTGGLGAQPLLGHGSHSSIFSPTDLNFLSPGLYNNFYVHLLLASVTIRTQFNPSTVKVVPWYLRPDAPVIYISSFDILAEVNMLQ